MKQKLTLTTLAALAITFCSAASAQIAEFTFTGGSLADSAGTANITVSDVSSSATGGTNGFNTFSSSSGWNSAAQISGAGSFFSSQVTQAAAGNAISFTITANSGFVFSITDFSFQARSTATAPSDIGFTINGTPYDFSGSYSNNSTITTISQSSLGFANLTSATITIQGWNASSSGALQLDNIAVSGSVVPEPGTFALLAGCFGMAIVMLKRRRG